MNMEILDDWEKIIGSDRVKMISKKILDNMLDMEFPAIRNGNYAYRKLSILSELENIGNMLIELERTDLLTHDEVSKMVDASARSIIGKNMPAALFNNVSMMLDVENFDAEDLNTEGEEEWLDREISYIGQILDSLNAKKKQYE